MTYKTKGTCSTMIDIEMEPDQHTIKSVAFTGGCNGNLKGISSLVVGMNAASSPRHVLISSPARWKKSCRRSNFYDRK